MHGPRYSPLAGRKTLRKWLDSAFVLLGFLSCAGVFVHGAIERGLEPSAWLDVRLQRSGCIRVPQVSSALEGYGFNSGLAFSPDGSTLAIAVDKCAIYLWDVEGQ